MKVQKKIIFHVLLLFAIILRLLLFTGLMGSDDLVYNNSAYKIIDVGYSELHKEALSSSEYRIVRLALYLPVSLSFLLFGVNEFSSNLYPLLCSVGILILVYKLGCLVFDKRLGFIAMVLYAIFPVEIIYATQLIPEMPLSLFMGLSVYLFLKYEKQNNNSKAGSVFNLFFSGIFIGLAYLTKITGILIIGFYVCYFIYKRQFNLRYLYIILGCLTIIFSEMAFYYYKTGDLFHHYYLLKMGGENLRNAGSNISNEYFGKYWTGFYRAFQLYPEIMFNPLGLFSIFYYGVFFSIVYFLWKKDKKAYVLIIWFLVIIFSLNFGVRSLSPLIFITGKPRHLILASIPQILLIGYCLSLAKTWKWKMSAFIFFMTFILTSAWVLRGHYLYNGRNISYNSRAIYKFLKDTHKTIYTDQRTTWNLQYLQEYRSDLLIKGFKYDMDVSALKSVSDCYVVINWNWINKSKAYYFWEFPEEIYSPPKNWKLVKSIDYPTSKPRGTGIVVGLRKILGFELKSKKKQQNDKVPPEKSKNAYIYYVATK